MESFAPFRSDRIRRSRARLNAAPPHSPPQGPGPEAEGRGGERRGRDDDKKKRDFFFPLFRDPFFPPPFGFAGGPFTDGPSAPLKPRTQKRAL